MQQAVKVGYVPQLFMLYKVVQDNRPIVSIIVPSLYAKIAFSKWCVFVHRKGKAKSKVI